MKDDLLSQATRALRESVDGSVSDARAAEERLVALLPRARRLRLVRPWGFSLAALLIGSSVWATSGGHLRPLLARLTASTPTISEPAPPKTKPRPRSRIATPKVLSAAPAEPAAETLPPAAEAPPATLPEPTPRSAREPTPAPESLDPAENPPALPTAGGSSALDVYEEAHRLHFLQHDFARALAAWDRYLALAPSGSLALEARFHRAVCLARLGNKPEARRALEPFARGVYGTYRQTQAQKLLDEIGAAAAP